MPQHQGISAPQCQEDVNPDLAAKALLVMAAFWTWLPTCNESAGLLQVTPSPESNPTGAR